MVSRLIGIGTSCPSTLARTRCWYGRHSVKRPEIVEDISRIGVKDVGAVAVDQNAVVVVVVVGVARDVWPLVDDQDLLVGSPTASRSANTLPANPAPTMR